MTTVAVTTAVPLSAELKKEVKAVAEKKLGSKDFELVETVDASVLGGIRLTIGSRQFDTTIQSRLASLRVGMK